MISKKQSGLVSPGETSKEKMLGCKFELEAGQCDGNRPLVVKKSYQVFECSWDDTLERAYEDKSRTGQLEGIEPPYHDFNGITSKFGCHFILKIDKILMKEKYYDAIINGVRASEFPHVPVDYGYRDSTNFWYSKFSRPLAVKIPAGKEADLQSVLYAANRMDAEIKFSEGACKMMAKVPRVFLKMALKGCIDWARENQVSLIDVEQMQIINDKRGKEKKSMRKRENISYGNVRTVSLFFSAAPRSPAAMIADRKEILLRFSD